VPSSCIENPPNQQSGFQADVGIIEPAAISVADSLPTGNQFADLWKVSRFYTSPNQQLITRENAQKLRQWDCGVSQPGGSDRRFDCRYRLLGKRVACEEALCEKSPCWGVADIKGDSSSRIKPRFSHEVDRRLWEGGINELGTIIAALHDSEINGEVSWFFDGVLAREAGRRNEWLCR
jgi:hypothetical protein